jgi:hypothetical protein
MLDDRPRQYAIDLSPRMEELFDEYLLTPREVEETIRFT